MAHTFFSLSATVRNKYTLLHKSIVTPADAHSVIQALEDNKYKLAYDKLWEDIMRHNMLLKPGEDTLLRSWHTSEVQVKIGAKFNEARAFMASKRKQDHAARQATRCYSTSTIMKKLALDANITPSMHGTEGCSSNNLTSYVANNANKEKTASNTLNGSSSWAKPSNYAEEKDEATSSNFSIK